MPRRLTLEQVRERFSRYGFTILDKNFVYRNAKQQVRVRDDITNRIEDVTIDALQKRINRGRVVEVDPFLHALHRTDTLTLTTPGRTRSSRWKREIRHFAQTQLPQFLDEDRHVQRQAIRIANSFHAIVSRGENITIQRTHDGDTDRANLYAFINTLYKVAELHQKPKFRNMWVVVAIRANGLDSYRHINDNTIALLQDLIQHIYFGESLDVITDSSSAVLFSLVDWESMSIEFVNSRLIKHNPLDGPHVAGDLEGSEFVDGESDRYGGTSTKLMSIYHATEYSTNSTQPTTATPVSCMHSNNPVSSHLKRSTLSMTPSIREHSRVILLSRSVSCMIVRLRWRK